MKCIILQCLPKIYFSKFWKSTFVPICSHDLLISWHILSNVINDVSSFNYIILLNIKDFSFDCAIHNQLLSHHITEYIMSTQEIGKWHLWQCTKITPLSVDLITFQSANLVKKNIRLLIYIINCGISLLRLSFIYHFLFERNFNFDNPINCQNWNFVRF